MSSPLIIDDTQLIKFYKSLLETSNITYLAAHSLRSLDRRRRTQKFCLRDMRRQKPQSLRDTINAYA